MSAGTQIMTHELERMDGEELAISGLLTEYARAGSGVDEALVQRIMSSISRRQEAVGTQLSLPAWRSLRIPLAAAAGIAVAVGLSVLVWSKTAVTDVGRIAFIEGGVSVQRRGEKMPAVDGFVLKPGDVVETPVSSKVEIGLSDGTRIALNEKTIVSVKKRGGTCEITLEKGQTYVEAARQEEGMALVFNGGQYDEASVVGTRFEMARSADATVLRVQDGIVRFGFRGGAVDVGPLQFSLVQPGGSPVAPMPVTVSGIAPWRGGTIYEDQFDGKAVSAFWNADPVGRVSIRNGFLSMDAGPVAAGEKRSEVTLTSPLIALMGQPVDFALTRNRADGKELFLPVNGEGAIVVEILDEAGKSVCQARMHGCILQNTGIPGTGYGIRLGDQEWKTVSGQGRAPTTWRFVVSPDGKVGVGKENYLLQSGGEVGHPIGSVRILLTLSVGGSEPARMNWDRMLIRRIEKWPDWRNATTFD